MPVEILSLKLLADQLVPLLRNLSCLNQTEAKHNGYEAIPYILDPPCVFHDSQVFFIFPQAKFSQQFFTRLQLVARAHNKVI